MLRHILKFYSSFAPAALIVTLACGYLYYTLGNNALVILIWFKLFTNFIVYYIIRQVREKKLYYYYNLHISKLRLWSVAFAADMLLLIFLLLIINPLSQHG